MLYRDQAATPQPQSHPLYATDRAVVDRLLSNTTPQAQDIADAARLLIRYDNFPGCPDIKQDLLSALRIWGLTRKELNDSARSLWRSGWRPAVSEQTEAVGSGADVSMP